MKVLKSLMSKKYRGQPNLRRIKFRSSLRIRKENVS